MSTDRGTDQVSLFPPILSTELWRQTPVDQWNLLLNASEQLMAGVFYGDREARWEVIPATFLDLLSVAACAFYRLEDGAAGNLVLAAAAPSGNESASLPKTVSLNDSGVVAEFCRARQPRVFTVEELRCRSTDSGNSLTTWLFHRGGTVLMLPVKDRKGYLSGAVFAVKGISSHDRAAECQARFSEQETLVGRCIVTEGRALLEHFHAFAVPRRLMQNIIKADNVYEILDAILHESLALLRADRGDLAIWEEDAGDLFVAIQAGESSVRLGQRIPPSSLMRHVWEDGIPRLVPDVHQEPLYYSCTPATRSEVIVRLDSGNRPIGVILAESFCGSGLTTAISRSCSFSLKMRPRHLLWSERKRICGIW